ncbi:MAG: ABC transporter permease [Balneolaceae bacterium]
MRLEFYLAGRYFRGNRKDSRFLSFVKIMAITGVAVGSAGLLIALSIVHGFKSVINDKVLGFAPHITVSSTVPDPLFRADTLETYILQYDGIEEIQQVVTNEVMLQSRADISGSAIKGVDPGGDVTDLHTYISEGRYFLGENDKGLPGIVLGSALARNIGAEIGSTVTSYTVEGIPTPFNTPEIVQFHLSGIYQTGIERFDDAFALADIQHVRTLFRLGQLQATGLDINASGIDRIESLQSELERALQFPYVSETIYQRYRNIFAWVDLQEQTIPFVISVMVIIAAFNLIGTVLMMVLERTRDIGILKTMGAGNKVIRRVFLLEGLFVAGVGLGIGISVAGLFNWLQGTYQIIPLAEENYYMNYAPVEPHALDFVIVTGITLILCGLASWLPARFAAKTDPVTVLSFT